jgi:cell division protein FtsB
MLGQGHSIGNTGICLVLLAICCVGSGFGRIWYGQQNLRIGRECQELERENVQLSRQYAVLEARIARLHTPSHLQTCARCHLAPPSRDRLQHISLKSTQDPARKVALAAMGNRKDGEPRL